MKKSILLLLSLLMVSALVVAQIKFVVYKSDGSKIMLLANEVDSIGFEGTNIEPDDNEDEEDMEDEEPFIPDANNHEYVDLGLPSGTLWATMNLGAEFVEDYGELYAWGDLEPKQGDTDSSRYSINGEYTKYHYYNYTDTIEGDNKTILELSDDAANVNWGGDWRMPTLEEFQELVENCTWDWVEKDSIEGMNVTGPNGNTIFLPAAGCSNYDVNIFGNYWSSTLDKFSPEFAYTLDIEPGLVRFDYSAFYNRNWGRSVRPILPAKNTYSIKFDANGGNGRMSMIKAKYAELVTLTENKFSNGDYDFIGWNTKADGTGLSYMENQTFSISSDLTLYAQWAKNVISGYENDYAYVDLDLPSGTLWATMNVGANSSEDYGDYFAWGETEPKDYYYWFSYKWMTDGMSSWLGVNKYTFDDGQFYDDGIRDSGVWYDENGNFIGDNKTVLDLKDDAANANWGGDWRMPTKVEQDELRTECTWTFWKKNGVSGYIVTGPNGNSIFLPAAGYCTDFDLFGEESYGYYWSSSLYTYNSGSAYYLEFVSGNVDWYTIPRLYGLSIRPVLSK